MQKLEYTQGPALPPSPGGKNLSPEQVQRDVTRLIVDQRVDNETFFDWVTASVGDENVKKHYFIRALTTAVCRSIIVDGKSGQCHGLLRLTSSTQASSPDSA